MTILHMRHVQTYTVHARHDAEAEGTLSTFSEFSSTLSDTRPVLQRAQADKLSPWKTLPALFPCTAGTLNQAILTTQVLV